MVTAIAKTIGQKVLHAETDQRWWYFRFVVAAIILTAAFMKSWELATIPVLGEGILKSRWLNIIAVELEYTGQGTPLSDEPEKCLIELGTEFIGADGRKTIFAGAGKMGGKRVSTAAVY